MAVPAGRASRCSEIVTPWRPHRGPHLALQVRNGVALPLLRVPGGGRLLRQPGPPPRSTEPPCARAPRARAPPRPRAPAAAACSLSRSSPACLQPCQSAHAPGLACMETELSAHTVVAACSLRRSSPACGPTLTEPHVFLVLPACTLGSVLAPRRPPAPSAGAPLHACVTR